MALYISPIFLAILFSVNFKCSFHDKFSSNRIPSNFIDDCLFITWLIIKGFGNRSGKSSLLLALLKIENFVFLTFKESLFEINQSSIFYTSLFTIEKKTLMSLCSKNRFASSANIIVFNKLEALRRLFTYIKNNSSPRIDPCGTPHFIFCSFVLLPLLMQMYCFLFVRYLLNQARFTPAISYISSFSRSIVWSAVSNAFDKSTKITAV